MSLLSEMYAAQNETNNRLAPAWHTEPYDFSMALIGELAECAEALAFEWWSGKVADLPAARIEYIDALHFYLSISLKRLGLSRCLVHTSNPSYDDMSWNVLPMVKSMAQTREVNVPNVIECIKCAMSLASEVMANTVSCREDAVQQLTRAMRDIAVALHMTPEQIASLYFAKTAINRFRKDNGYKEGRYDKYWNLHLAYDNYGYSEPVHDGEFMHDTVTTWLDNGGKAFSNAEEAEAALLPMFTEAYNIHLDLKK